MKNKKGMKERFPGWKGTKRGKAKQLVEPYSTKPLLYRVKTPLGYVAFGSLKSVKKFIRKMKNAEARKAAKQT